MYRFPRLFSTLLFEIPWKTNSMKSWLFNATPINRGWSSIHLFKDRGTDIYLEEQSDKTKLSPTVRLPETAWLILNLLLQPDSCSLCLWHCCALIPYWSFPHPYMHACTSKKCLLAETVAQKGHEAWNIYQLSFNQKTVTTKERLAFDSHVSLSELLSLLPHRPNAHAAFQMKFCLWLFQF